MSDVDLNAPEVQAAIKAAREEATKEAEGAIAKKDQLLAETKAEREKRRALEDQLSKLQGVDADEYEKLKAAQAEQEKAEAEKKGEYEKLTSKLKETYEKQISELTETLTAKEQTLHNTVKSNENLSAMNAEKANAKLLGAVLDQMTRVEEVEGRLVTIGLDERGEPLMTEDGKMGTPRDVVKYLKTKEDYWGAFDASVIQGGSSRPSSGTLSGTKNPWKQESFNLSQQGQIMRQDPALAARLQREA